MVTREGGAPLTAELFCDKTEEEIELIFTKKL
jgi:hypothetical protein